MRTGITDVVIPVCRFIISIVGTSVNYKISKNKHAS